MRDFYDPDEAHINQIASGTALFFSALVGAISALDALPPEGRTARAFLENLVAGYNKLQGLESVTDEAVFHARAMLDRVVAAVLQESLES